MVEFAKDFYSWALLSHLRLLLLLTVALSVSILLSRSILLVIASLPHHHDGLLLALSDVLPCVPHFLLNAATSSGLHSLILVITTLRSIISTLKSSLLAKTSLVLTAY